MGTCFNCKKVISISKDEGNCPFCGEPPYNCWDCKGEISGLTEECPVCHFYKCPNCGVCGKNCKIPTLIEEVKGMDWREAIEHIYKSVKMPDRMNCPSGVPISYGHNKLRNMALKLKGVGGKNKEDTEAFTKRFDKIISFRMGYKWTINKEKELGQYGIELREVSNLAICMGKAIKRKVERKDNDGKIINEYEEFEKVEKIACQHSNWDNLMGKHCPKCKQIYSIGKEYCTNCIYKKGTQKGGYRKLRDKKSKIHFCQLSRKDYKKKEEKNE